MKENKGFTLIELLAVIVVLSIVMVIAATSVLPYMSKATEKSFRIEATSLVESAKNAYDLYNLNQISIDGENSCKVTNEMCFEVEELVRLGLYKGDITDYKGTVTIDITNSKKPIYTINFKKGNEYALIEQTGKKFNESGTLSDINDWDEEVHEVCSCVQEYELAGTWVFNDSIDTNVSLDVSITFTSTHDDGITTRFIGMYIDKGFMGNSLFYRDSNQERWLAYDISAYDGGWRNNDGCVFKQIDFGIENQVVSEDFFNWFTANATKQ
ncbi:MAG: type II secretion system protein [Bacilli bacterium]|nr:type II secretion system protein [Bacilli bacterium]